jgi:hypothetical protein
MTESRGPRDFVYVDSDIGARWRGPSAGQGSRACARMAADIGHRTPRRPEPRNPSMTTAACTCPADVGTRRIRPTSWLCRYR